MFRIALLILSCSALHAEEIAPVQNPALVPNYYPPPQPQMQSAAPMYPTPPQAYYPPQPSATPQPDPNSYPVAPTELPPQPSAGATPQPAASAVSNVADNEPTPSQDTLTTKSEVEMQKIEKMIEEEVLNSKATESSGAVAEKKAGEKPAQANVPTGTPLGSTLPPPPEAAKKDIDSEPKQSPFPITPEVAIILSHHRFHPEKVRLKKGIQTRLIFTTLNKRPAALIIERLDLQRWLAKDPPPANVLEKAQWEVNREISTDRMTEIIIEPEKGEYSFHDALTGAKGEIIVE